MSAKEDLAVFPSTSFATSAKTLLQAAGIAGGIQALARRLRVPTKQLTSWMEGDVLTPHTVFLRAVELLRCGNKR